MIFQILLTETARSNLRHYYLHAARNAAETAFAWLSWVEQLLQALSAASECQPLALEDHAVAEEIRQFTFGKRAGTFLVLFTTTGSDILVLHIRRITSMDSTPISIDDLSSFEPPY